jgi:hypothetical protein
VGVKSISSQSCVIWHSKLGQIDFSVASNTNLILVFRIGEFSLLRELAMLQAVGRSEGVTPQSLTIVVLHHTDCGIKRLEGRHEMLTAFFEISQDALTRKALQDPHQSLRVDLAVLRAAPLPPTWTVVGLLYDVTTGLVEPILEMDN